MSGQDRHEPLPNIAELPAWLWRRSSRAVRIGVGLVLLGLIALGVALAPGIGESKREREAAEAHRRSDLRADRIARQRAEQKPRFASAEAPARSVRARQAVLAEISTSILRDARGRIQAGELESPVKRAECEPFPRTTDGRGADDDLSRRRGRYACVAVTAEFRPGRASEGGLIGYPYRVLVDFESGRYAWCKIAGRSGEGGLVSQPDVTVPKACGGL